MIPRPKFDLSSKNDLRPHFCGGRLQAPGDELMEYICQQNNQYGIADGYPNPFAQ